jgi:hypothetical protein
MTPSAQLDLLAYVPPRAVQVEAAAEHAEAELPGWKADAVAWVRAYSGLHIEFVSEDCTDAGYEAGILKISEPRAWGQIYRYCASRGWIKKSEKAGWSKKRASNTTLWVSVHPNFARAIA